MWCDISSPYPGHPTPLRCGGHGPPSDDKLGANCELETGEGVKLRGTGALLPYPFENPNPTTTMGLPHSRAVLAQDFYARQVYKKTTTYPPLQSLPKREGAIFGYGHSITLLRRKNSPAYRIHGAVLCFRRLECRKLTAHLQAAFGQVAGTDLAALGFHQLAGNRKSQAGTAGST